MDTVTDASGHEDAELATLTKQLQLATLGRAQWVKLHKWAMVFRRTHKLTCATFLRDVCKLKPLPYYQQLLSENGFKRPVAAHPSSKGGQLLEALSLAHKKYNEDKLPYTPQANLPVPEIEQFENCVYEFGDELRTNGISSIRLEQLENNSIQAIVHRHQSSNWKEEHVRAFFLLQHGCSVSNLTVDFWEVEYLGSPLFLQIDHFQNEECPPFHRCNLMVGTWP